MISIVTGPINSGKTSKLIKLYYDLNKGDGFISTKKISNNIVIGYDLMKLSTQLKKTFILRKEYLTKEWQEDCSIGYYSFSEPTINYVESNLRLLMQKKVCPIFLDEIGPLELQDKCFHTIFKELLQYGCNLYISVRKDCLDKVIRKYEIHNIKIYYP